MTIIELPKHIWRIDFDVYYCEICNKKIIGYENAFPHSNICKENGNEIELPQSRLETLQSYYD